MSNNKINIILFNNVHNAEAKKIEKGILDIVRSQFFNQSLLQNNLTVSYKTSDVTKLIDEGYNTHNKINLISTASNSKLEMGGGLDAVIDTKIQNVKEKILSKIIYFKKDNNVSIPVGSGLIYKFKKCYLAIIPTMANGGTDLVASNKEENIFKAALAAFHLAEILKYELNKDINLYIPFYGTSVGRVSSEKYICYMLAAIDFFARGLRLKNSAVNITHDHGYYFQATSNILMSEDVYP